LDSCVPALRDKGAHAGKPGPGICRGNTKQPSHFIDGRIAEICGPPELSEAAEFESCQPFNPGRGGSGFRFSGRKKKTKQFGPRRARAGRRLETKPRTKNAAGATGRWDDFLPEKRGTEPVGWPAKQCGGGSLRPAAASRAPVAKKKNDCETLGPRRGPTFARGRPPKPAEKRSTDSGAKGPLTPASLRPPATEQWSGNFFHGKGASGTSTPGGGRSISVIGHHGNSWVKKKTKTARRQFSFGARDHALVDCFPGHRGEPSAGRAFILPDVKKRCRAV